MNPREADHPAHAGPTEALEAASRVLRERFPGARFAFAAGSILRAEGRPGSDIDLVVVFDRLDAAWRESFVAHGFPFEAFVHDAETLDWFVERDVSAGRPVLAHMVAEGVAIGPNAPAADELRRRMCEIVEAGPPRLEEERLDELRYIVSDLVTDLEDALSEAEMQAIAAAIHRPLADLILLGRGSWTGTGKWIPRLLDRLDPVLARGVASAFRDAVLGKPAALIHVADLELARYGGRFFDGDHRDAAPTARRQQPAG